MELPAPRITMDNGETAGAGVVLVERKEGESPPHTRCGAGCRHVSRFHSKRTLQGK